MIEKISSKLESLVESVDGEGNKHWKRDIVISVSITIFTLFIVVFSMTYLRHP